MADWTLGIDFGTTFTLAAMEQDGRLSLVHDGAGVTRVRSAVWLDDDGELVVGDEAVRQAVLAPERFEPAPKRLVRDREEEILLGDKVVPVSDVIGAVLARVAGEAIRQNGGSQPSELRITHPAAWGEERCDTLIQAVHHAGLPRPELVPEPVAAAYKIGADQIRAGEPIKSGEHLAIYDFGGGTFDTAIVRRTRSGFEVAGPPGGEDPLGGESIDQAIIELLGRQPIGEDPQWELLMHPRDEDWRRHAADLRVKVREAKEALSRSTSVRLWVPGIGRSVQLSRDELNELIRTQVDGTAAILRETISDAGIAPEQLAGIFLVGGSSRIPLVAETIWREFQRKPEVRGDPKAVVAEGAAWDWRGTVIPPAGAPFRSRLAMAKTIKLVWTRATHGSAQLTASGEGGLVTIGERTARVGDVAELARAAGSRWEQVSGYTERALRQVAVLGRDGGLERTLTADHLGTAVRWIERYAVIEDRAYVITAQEAVRGVADSARLARPTRDPAQVYEPSTIIVVPEGWSVVERVELERAGTSHRIIAEGHPVEAGMTTERWAQQRIQSLPESAGTVIDGPARARVFGRDGGIVYTTRTERGWLTRHWMLVDESRGYVVRASLSRQESLGFKLLFPHALLLDPQPSREVPPAQPVDAVRSGAIS